MEKYKIIIADDHPIIHIGVDMVFKKNPAYFMNSNQFITVMI
jgi:DNA-binding NarL/FixJ family response regulator